MPKIRIHHGTTDLDVNIVTVDTRCVDIIVHDDLTVDMKVPIGMNQDMIQHYVKMNEQRIVQLYESCKMRNHQVLPVTLELENGRIIYRSGQKLPYLGRMDLILRIKFHEEDEETRIYDDENLDGSRVLTIRTDNDDQNFLRYCVMRYYKKCAAQIVNQKVYDYGRDMKLAFNHVKISGQVRNTKISIPKLTYKNLEIKDQKTLWGSCSRQKNLRFDWKLAMLPEEVIDYIIVHELAHLKKMNHSAGFWAEIEKVMPEYQECRSWLNKHGKEYEIF